MNNLLWNHAVIFAGALLVTYALIVARNAMALLFVPRLRELVQKPRRSAWTLPVTPESPLEMLGRTQPLTDFIRLATHSLEKTRLTPQ